MGTTDFDEIDQLIRAAAPTPYRRSDRVSTRGLQELEALTVYRPTVPVPARDGRRRHRTMWASLAVAAAAVSVTVLVLTFTAPSPAAIAATPPMLAFTASDAPSEHVLNELAARAETLGDSSVDGMTRNRRIETWRYPILEDQSTPPDLVQSQIQQQSWMLDGTVHVVTSAGSPITTVGAPNDVADAVRPGTIFADRRYTVDEFGLCPLEGVALDTPTDLATALNGMGDEFSRDADFYVRTMSTLVSTCSTPDLHLPLFYAMLAAQPHVKLLGETTDRLGRHGIAFQTKTSTPLSLEHILIVDPKSGALLSQETILTGDTVKFLRGPAVIEYTLWS